MARVWKMASGFEHGNVQRSNLTNTLINHESDMWDTALTDTLETTIVRTGKYTYDVPSAGFGAHTTQTSGHVEARTQNFIFWNLAVNVNTFAGGAPTVDDDYVIARCAEIRNSGAGGTDYLAIGMEVSGVGPPITVQFVIHRFNSDGSFDTDLVGNSANYTVGTTGWVFLTLAMDIPNGKAKLYYNGTAGTEITTG